MRRSLLAALALLPLAACGASEGSPTWCQERTDDPTKIANAHEVKVFADKCGGAMLQEAENAMKKASEDLKQATQP